MTVDAVPMDTFKWIVTGLLGTLLVCVGWLLSDIRADLRDMRKEVTAIRVDAAASNMRLDTDAEPALEADLAFSGTEWIKPHFPRLDP
jgi:hypothetical protein